MLEILGTIIGNILSLPGILGFALGMMTRSLVVAAILGVVVGAGEALIFADFSLAKVDALEMSVSVAVGIIFATFGSLTRRKGASI